MVFLDVRAHFIVGPAGGIHIQVILERVVFNELIGSMTALADLAVHERIGEAAEVTGRDPGLGIHDDRGIETNVVLAFRDEFFPPCLLDVVLELHTQRTVIPRIGQTAVDFAPGVDKASVLA